MKRKKLTVALGWLCNKYKKKEKMLIWRMGASISVKYEKYKMCNKLNKLQLLGEKKCLSGKGIHKFFIKF